MQRPAQESPWRSAGPALPAASSPRSARLGPTIAPPVLGLRFDLRVCPASVPPYYLAQAPCRIRACIGRQSSKDEEPQRVFLRIEAAPGIQVHLAVLRGIKGVLVDFLIEQLP